jgi:hypothetical protein
MPRPKLHLDRASELCPTLALAQLLLLDQVLEIAVKRILDLGLEAVEPQVPDDHFTTAPAGTIGRSFAEKAATDATLTSQHDHGRRLVVEQALGERVKMFFALEVETAETRLRPLEPQLTQITSPRDQRRDPIPSRKRPGSAAMCSPPTTISQVQPVSLYTYRKPL